jgi:hypothetical protein
MVATTNDKYLVDASDVAIITSNVHTTLNSPKVYLGEDGNENEPVLLGRTSTLWLTSLCNLMIGNIDIQIGLAQVQRSHIHFDLLGMTGSPTPEWVTQTTTYIKSLTEQRKNLVELRDTLPRLMSQRVFTVGGGGAPGHDGK